MNEVKVITNKQLFKQTKKDNKERLKQQSFVDLLSFSFSIIPNNTKGLTKLYFVLLCSTYFMGQLFKKSVSFINPKNFNDRWVKIIFWLLVIISAIVIGISFTEFSPMAYWKNSQPHFVLDLVISIILGIIGAIFTVMVAIVEPILTVLVYAIQASIYFIGVFPMILSLTNVSTLMLLGIFFSIFLVLLVLFSMGALFDKMKVKTDDPRQAKINLLFNSIKSIAVFAGTIVFFILSMYISSLVIEIIFGYDFMSINLVEIVRNITNIQGSEVAPFFNSLMFIIILWALINNLFKFLMILGQRTIEIIVYGTIGASVSISASAKDNGDRFNQYFVVMVNKIWTPMFVFIGYMLFMYIIEPITTAITSLPMPNWGYMTNEVWSWTKLVMSTIFIIAGSGLMTSLMKSLGILVAGNNFMAAMGSEVGQMQQSLRAPVSMMGRVGRVVAAPFTGGGSVAAGMTIKGIGKFKSAVSVANSSTNMRHSLKSPNGAVNLENLNKEVSAYEKKSVLSSKNKPTITNPKTQTLPGKGGGK